jgi:hypothetical protein
MSENRYVMAELMPREKYEHLMAAGLTEEDLGWIAWAVKQEHARKIKQREHAAEKFGAEFDPEMLQRKLEFLSRLFAKLTGGTL